VAKADIIWRWAPRRLNKAQTEGQFGAGDTCGIAGKDTHRKVKREANELL